MQTRVYLKENIARTKQVMFVAYESEICDDERYFNGYQSTITGGWVEWDMLEKDINRLTKEGRMVRIQ